MVDPDTLTYDEWDALLIEEWFQADPGAPVPVSSREGELVWAHDNRAAWRLVRLSTLDGLSKAEAEEMMRLALPSVEGDQLMVVNGQVVRHYPGKHNQKTHGNWAHKAPPKPAAPEPAAEKPKPAPKKTAPAAAPATVDNGRGGRIRPLVASGDFHEITDAEAEAMNPTWTKAQRQALRTYTGQDYKKINGRKRGYERTTKYDRVIDDMHAALQPLPTNVKVYRSVEAVAFGFKTDTLSAREAKSMIGRTFSDPGFTSTSISRVSTQYAVHLVISVPAGTRAGYLERLTKAEGEEELLLDAGTHFKVTGVGKHNELQLTVVGQDE